MHLLRPFRPAHLLVKAPRPSHPPHHPPRQLRHGARSFSSNNSCSAAAAATTWIVMSKPFLSNFQNLERTPARDVCEEIIYDRTSSETTRTAIFWTYLTQTLPELPPCRTYKTLKTLSLNKHRPSWRGRERGYTCSATITGLASSIDKLSTSIVLPYHLESGTVEKGEHKRSGQPHSIDDQKGLDIKKKYTFMSMLTERNNLCPIHFITQG